MPGFGGAVKLTGESEYRRALQGITQQLREQSAQMRAVVGSYESGESAQEAARRKTKELNDVLDKQQSALRELQDQQKKMERAVQEQADAHQTLKVKYDEEKRKLDEIGRTLGEASDEYKKQEKVVGELENELKKSETAQNRNEQSMSKMRTEVAKAETACNNTKKEIRALGESAEDSGKKAEKGGEQYTALKNTIGNLAADAIEKAVAGLKKLADKVIEVGKLAYANYADYEQLVGGVETLFGESADIVQKNAAKAYRTAGISANKYMEQATSFSATLLQGLEGDTARAAAAADLAIRDMSDNANKMGTDMSMIQSAYQGFAKDNYTMLDNLKLGYGGTAGEMARLINDTGVMKDVVNEAGEAFVAEAKTVKDVPFDKMIEAIHIVQEQMGITGTTSLEAAGTISGSAGSMKAAWENLTVAIGDGNGDIKKSVGEFIDTVIAAAKNAIPRIKQIADGMKDMVISFVRDSIPKLKRSIPEIKPVIEAFEWFVKHRKAFVTAVGAMLAAFAVSKLVSFGKKMSEIIASVATSIIQHKLAAAAKIGDTAATTGLTAAQTTLNAVMAANPVGLVIAALGILVGVIGTVIASTNKLTDAEKEQNAQEEEQARKQQDLIDAAEQRKKSLDELEESVQKEISAGLSVTTYHESLKRELDELMTGNDELTDAQKRRADFIMSELAEAYGIDLEGATSLREQYGLISESIDQLIDKKRAQIILDAQEQEYKQAYEGMTDAIEDRRVKMSALTTAQAKLNNAVEAGREALNDDFMPGFYTDLYGEAAASWETLTKAVAEGAVILDEQVTPELVDAYNAWYDGVTKVSEAQSAYEEADELVQRYAYNTDIYLHNVAAAHDNNFGDMITATWEYTHQFEDAENAKFAQLAASVRDEAELLQIAKQNYEETGDTLYKEEVERRSGTLATAMEALDNYVADTGGKLTELGDVWTDELNGVAMTIDGHRVVVQKSGDGTIKAYADGIEDKSGYYLRRVTDSVTKETVLGLKTGEKQEKQAGADASKQYGGGIESESRTVGRCAKNVGTNAVHGYRSVYNDAYGSGGYLDSGVANGIYDNAYQAIDAATYVANSIADIFHNVLQINSPSKVTMKVGQSVTEGLRLGMLKDAAGVARDAAGLGETIRQSLSGATDGMRLTAGTITPAVTARAEARRDSMVEEFKSALSQMRVMLDGEAAGRFVERTVTRAVFS